LNASVFKVNLAFNTFICKWNNQELENEFYEQTKANGMASMLMNKMRTEASENSGLDTVGFTDKEWQVGVCLLDAGVVLSDELPVIADAVVSGLALAGTLVS
jgi:hypothetical protein